MPELPEVETIRRQLAPELAGRRIREAAFHKADILLGETTPAQAAAALRGRRIEEVARRGKYLLLHLDGDLVLQTQLRMTGRFALARREPPAEAELTHIAAEFDLDDGRTLFYDDVRRLGGFRLLPAPAWRELERELGPEPLAPGFTAERLAVALEGRRAPVKNVLLDQRRVAGIGNIYAAEALHAARIDPRRAGGSLKEDEVGRLHRALRRVLRRALAGEGTTFRDYRSVNGSGRHQERLRVYGREGDPCPRCGTAVERIVQAGRSTFFCPSCQI